MYTLIIRDTLNFFELASTRRASRTKTACGSVHTTTRANTTRVFACVGALCVLLE